MARKRLANLAKQFVIFETGNRYRLIAGLLAGTGARDDNGQSPLCVFWDEQSARQGQTFR